MLPGEDAALAESAPDTQVKEVRYSLPRIMRELALERNSSVFAREILDQIEIGQLFANRRKKHDKRRKQ